MTDKINADPEKYVIKRIDNDWDEDTVWVAIVEIVKEFGDNIITGDLSVSDVEDLFSVKLNAEKFLCK